MMTRLDKIRSIYQCSLDDAHENVTQSIAIGDMFKHVNEPIRITIPPDVVSVIEFVRELFVPGFFYSLPVDCLASCNSVLAVDDPVAFIQAHQSIGLPMSCFVCAMYM